ncbi:S-methyl-5-thioribose-1-phosphate isomerase [bacterium]|nr:S-methyl-5-thioribose-1-phosphate isomerase [bacterium]
MKPVIWCGDCAKLIDQTLLPTQEEWITCRTPDEMAEAIFTMKVRGAPAIGISAAYGIALGAINSKATSLSELQSELAKAHERLRSTRPTAVNLFWALQEMRKIWEANNADIAELKQRLTERACAIAEEDITMCKTMGAHGAELVPEHARILTHCNAGALATGDYGTALGVIRAAWEQGKLDMVWVDETRPFLQGARLTAWELMQDGIPCKLICDNMAGFVMKQGLIDMAVVGADRITANGHVANKIGTYSVATLCKAHGIPFYVAAPYSTIDPTLHDGKDIVIEERHPDELTTLAGKRIAPAGVPVYNPAFDVTPPELISAIITERGIFRPPYDQTLVKAFS